MPSHEDEFELIELNERAREFLLLEVKETQQNLVASVAQSYADALFPPTDYKYGPPLPWIRGVLLNSEPAASVSYTHLTLPTSDLV